MLYLLTSELLPKMRRRFIRQAYFLSRGGFARGTMRNRPASFGHAGIELRLRLSRFGCPTIRKLTEASRSSEFLSEVVITNWSASWIVARQVGNHLAERQFAVGGAGFVVALASGAEPAPVASHFRILTAIQRERTSPITATRKSPIRLMPYSAIATASKPMAISGAAALRSGQPCRK